MIVELDIVLEGIAIVTVAVAVVLSVVTAELDASPAALPPSVADCGDISGVAGVKMRVTFCAPCAEEVEFDGGADVGAVEFDTASKEDVILATLALDGVSGSSFPPLSSFPAPLSSPSASSLGRWSLPSSSPSNHMGRTTPESEL